MPSAGRSMIVGGKFSPMSTEQFFAQEGLLLRQRGRLILQCDDGAVRILRMEIGAVSMLGERVRVEGVQTDANELEVSRIVPC